MLELKNITKTFGNVVANNDVSITVHTGTIHAIVGENGAGKSTIMRIAYGFYNADSGEILLDGKRVADPQPARRDRARDRDGPPAFYAGRYNDRRREYRARGRDRQCSQSRHR